MTLAGWFYAKHPRRPSVRRPRHRSRPRPHAFRLEPLEPRLLLSADDPFLAALALQLEPATGVTVITHGIETTDAGGNSLLPLARAIEERTGGWLVDYDAGATGDDRASGERAGPGTEVILLFDWAGASIEPSPGWAEAGGDALFGLLVGLDLVEPTAGANNLRLHFIGQGEGAAVTSEAVERLARFDGPVDHLTYPDQHDFAQPDIAEDGPQRLSDLGQPAGYGAVVWENVDFADVYYQTRGLDGAASPTPEGRPIPGAFNVLLGDDVILPDDDAGNPYSPFDLGGDHDWGWSGVYLWTVTGNFPAGAPAPAAPVDLSSTGFAFSRVADPAGTLRSAPELVPNFYGELQDH